MLWQKRNSRTEKSCPTINFQWNRLRMYENRDKENERKKNTDRAQ